MESKNISRRPQRNAIIYTRISTIKQNLDSLDTQEMIGRNWSESNGYSVLDVVRDDAISGTKMETRSLKECLSRLSAGDCLVFQDIARCARNTEEYLVLKRELENRRIKHVFTKFPNVDANTSTGTLLLTNLAAMAQHEAEHYREKTCTAMAARQARGQIVSRIPYGWRRVHSGDERVTDSKEPHPFEWKVLETIAYWRLEEKPGQHTSFREIARRLNTALVYPPAKKVDLKPPSLKHDADREVLWSHGAVNRVFRIFMAERQKIDSGPLKCYDLENIDRETGEEYALIPTRSSIRNVSMNKSTVQQESHTNNAATEIGQKRPLENTLQSEIDRYVEELREFNMDEDEIQQAVEAEFGSRLSTEQEEYDYAMKLKSKIKIMSIVKKKFAEKFPNSAWREEWD